MWVARPTPLERGKDNILPVDFVAITQGLTGTNYQGCRAIASTSSTINWWQGTITSPKLIDPIGRLLNLTSLGSDTTRNIQTLGRSYNSSRSGI